MLNSNGENDGGRNGISVKMDQTEHHDSPHDALIKALENVDRMEKVLIIYEGRDGSKAGSFDSDLTIADALYLIKLFEHWLLVHTLGSDD
jgi:hypothetical protein